MIVVINYLDRLYTKASNIDLDNYCILKLAFSLVLLFINYIML